MDRSCDSLNASLEKHSLFAKISQRNLCWAEVQTGLQLLAALQQGSAADNMQVQYVSTGQWI